MATTESFQLSLIGVLVLIRLLPVSEKGESRARIRKDLEPMLLHRWPGAALAEQIGRALDELEVRQLVKFLRGKSKKSVAKGSLTADGRQHALALLGIDELKPKTTWSTLRKIHLPAHVLGLSLGTDAAIKAIGSDAAFKAILLKQEFCLPGSLPPKMDAVLDALAWQLIGFDGSVQKFTLKAVKTALFNRALGDGHATEFKTAANQLLAKRLGARRDDGKELRDAILRGWVKQQSQVESCNAELAKDRPTPAAMPEIELDLRTFAERVKAAASACTTGRYGSNKVFVAHVWKALQSDPFFEDMSVDEFKVRLAQANNARLLDLGRADLVQAMDQDDVRQSEIQYLSATFHFVRI